MTTTTAAVTHDTPVGRLTLAATERGLTRARFGPARRSTGHPTPAAQAWLDMARRELDAYFAGELRGFTVPLDLSRGADEHRRVLDALADVRYGTTTTYGALAAQLGLVDDGPRRVGAALARNPVLVIIGCHRVLGTDGSLTGYAGGLATKQALLDLECRDRPGQLPLAI